MTDQARLDRAIYHWRNNWNLFARDALGAKLDPQQQSILDSVQHNSRTSVASGTARGKDFVAAVSALCFMYLTPVWHDGKLISNTKVALTAPTAAQIKNIMKPEFSRLFRQAHARGIDLPGRLVATDIRTEYDEWFLTGFKSDDHNTESWTGFHAINTMFVITEASGIAENIFNAIEGNLQGNSRILIVFNPNKSVGYAANSQKSSNWHKFRLNSLDAPNVVAKQELIPGQVDYNWVRDKVNIWARPVLEPDPLEDDFQFDGAWYRPDDTFRVKVLGKFPKVSEDNVIPPIWVDIAMERHAEKGIKHGDLRLGVDVAGMGRDNSAFAYRYGDYVDRIDLMQSGGEAQHMAIAGRIKHALDSNGDSLAYIDTIGEGAGVYSRLVEQSMSDRVYSVKNSERNAPNGSGLTDVTGQFEFENMRAYLYWAIRDWLNPDNKNNAALPPIPELKQELTEAKWKFGSNGKIILEPKDDIVKRLRRSPDYADALSTTFYPVAARRVVKGMSKADLGFY